MVSEYGKMPPQAIELEEAVLGALMLEKDAYSTIEKILVREAFYNESHQKIFTAISEINKTGGICDILTVTSVLKSKEQLDQVGGPFYVTKLTSRVASAAHIEYHARMIIDCYLKREMIRIASNVQSRAFDDGEDFLDIMEYFEQEMDEIATFIRELTYHTETTEEVLQNIEQYMTSGSNPMHRSLVTCQPHLDNFFRFCAGEVILWGARKKAGKTRLLHFIVLLFLLFNKKCFIYIRSMEDPIQDVIMNFISYFTGITGEEQRQEKGYVLTDDDKIKIRDAMDKISEFMARIHIEPRKDFICGIKRDFEKHADKFPDDYARVLIVDNLSLTKDIMERGKKSMYDAQFDAAGSIQDLKNEKDLIFIVHHVKASNEQELERGYRLTTEDLGFSERLGGVITQAYLINNTSKHKDLVDLESTEPDLFINNRHVPRKYLMENMIIIEKTEDRKGSAKEEDVILRLCPADLGKMKFSHFTGDISRGTVVSNYEDRNITDCSEDMFFTDLFSINPDGDKIQAYKKMMKVLGTKDSAGKIITFDFLASRYSEYYKAKVPFQNAKFTNREDRIKSIQKWLEEGMYNKQHSFHKPINSARESYLYGI